MTNPKSKIQNPKWYVKRPHREKDIGACGLVGLLNRDGARISGEPVIRAIANLHERGNGLGGGFAAYGIYPDYPDWYALHVMFDRREDAPEVEDFLAREVVMAQAEELPLHETPKVPDHPYFRRYFVRPKASQGDLSSVAFLTSEASAAEVAKENGEGGSPPVRRLADTARGACTDRRGSAYLGEGLPSDDRMVDIVMHINRDFEHAFVVSSGKNMGAFKGVGYPEDLAELFRLDDYEAYLWTAHNRFPTNTPGWWGGAHPFTLLDWSIVHNGEISSYGINRRYVEMFGYHCTLLTDTEVVTYLLDLLVRRHGLSFREACTVLAPPFWKDIDRMEEPQRTRSTELRMIYGSAALNGPFAFLLGFDEGLIGLNDRVKLRPLVVAENKDTVYMSSEEAAIRVICPDVERVFAPVAGEPVIATLYPSSTPYHPSSEPHPRATAAASDEQISRDLARSSKLAAAVEGGGAGVADH